MALENAAVPTHLRRARGEMVIRIRAVFVLAALLLCCLAPRLALAGCLPNPLCAYCGLLPASAQMRTPAVEAPNALALLSALKLLYGSAFPGRRFTVTGARELCHNEGFCDSAATAAGGLRLARRTMEMCGGGSGDAQNTTATAEPPPDCLSFLRVAEDCSLRRFAIVGELLTLCELDGLCRTCGAEVIATLAAGIRAAGALPKLVEVPSNGAKGGRRLDHGGRGAGRGAAPMAAAAAAAAAPVFPVAAVAAFECTDCRSNFAFGVWSPCRVRHCCAADSRNAEARGGLVCPPAPALAPAPATATAPAPAARRLAATREVATAVPTKAAVEVTRAPAGQEAVQTRAPVEAPVELTPTPCNDCSTRHEEGKWSPCRMEYCCALHQKQAMDSKIGGVAECPGRVCPESFNCKMPYEEYEIWRAKTGTVYTHLSVKVVPAQDIAEIMRSTECACGSASERMMSEKQCREEFCCKRDSEVAKKFGMACQTAPTPVPTPAPVDCAVSDFGDWTTCTEPCGEGVQSRSRTIERQPRHDGQACPGLAQKQKCNTQPCPRNDCSTRHGKGKWSPCRREYCCALHQKNATDSEIGGVAKCPERVCPASFNCEMPYEEYEKWRAKTGTIYKYLSAKVVPAQDIAEIMRSTECACRSASERMMSEKQCREEFCCRWDSKVAKKFGMACRWNVNMYQVTTRPPRMPAATLRALWALPAPASAQTRAPAATTTFAPTSRPTPFPTPAATAASSAGTLAGSINSARQQVLRANGTYDRHAAGLAVLQRAVRSVDALASSGWWPALTEELKVLGGCWDKRWRAGCGERHPVLLPKKAADYYQKSRGFVCLSAAELDQEQARNTSTTDILGTFERDATRINATVYRSCRNPRFSIELTTAAGAAQLKAAAAVMATQLGTLVGGLRTVAAIKAAADAKNASDRAQAAVGEWRVVYNGTDGAPKDLHRAGLGDGALFGVMPPKAGWETVLNAGRDAGVMVTWGVCAGWDSQCGVAAVNGTAAWVDTLRLAMAARPDKAGRDYCVADMVFESRGLSGGRSVCGPANAMCCNIAEGGCSAEQVSGGTSDVSELTSFGTPCPPEASMTGTPERPAPCGRDELGQRCAAADRHGATALDDHGGGVGVRKRVCTLDLEQCALAPMFMCWLEDTSSLMDVPPSASELSMLAPVRVAPVVEAAAAAAAAANGSVGVGVAADGQQSSGAGNGRLLDEVAPAASPAAAGTTKEPLTPAQIRAQYPQLTRCAHYSGKHCCPALDVRTMYGQQHFAHAAVEEAYNMTMENARLKFGACAASCVTNIERLFCAAMCSPEQDMFLSVQPHTFGRDRKVTLTLGFELCSALFGSCEDATDVNNEGRIYRYTYKKRARDEAVAFPDRGSTATAYQLFTEQQVAVFYVHPYAQRPVPVRLNVRCQRPAPGNTSSARQLGLGNFSSATPEMTAFCEHPGTLEVRSAVSLRRRAVDAATRDRWRAALGVQGAEHDCRRLMTREGERIPQFCEPPSDSFQAKAIRYTFVMLLFFAAAHIGNALHQAHVTWIPESGAFILVGALTGALALAVGEAGGFGVGDLARYVAVSPDVIALLLLPPIIFQSGYTLRWRPFADQLGSIMTFAIFGTAISTVIVSETLFALGDGVKMPLLGKPEAYMFGSLISAVDPVATLAAFSSLKVERNVEALVCGEALINDAMAIVLFRAFKHEVASGTTSLDGSFAPNVLVSFFQVGMGSLAIGVAVGMLATAYFRVTSYAHNQDMEAWVLLAFAYASYILAEVPHFSGILSTLVCGVICNQFADFNMSVEGERQAHMLGAQACLISETVLFIVCGIITVVASVGGEGVAHYGARWNFGILNSSGEFFGWTLLMIMVGRGVALGMLGSALNMASNAHCCAASHRLRLTPNVLVLMWSAGLRGAIAIGLALDLPTPHRYTMLTTTCAIVIFTTFVFGGATQWVLRTLKIEMGVEDSAREEADESRHHMGRKQSLVVSKLDKLLLRPAGWNGGGSVTEHMAGKARSALRHWSSEKACYKHQGSERLAAEEREAAPHRESASQSFRRFEMALAKDDTKAAAAAEEEEEDDSWLDRETTQEQKAAGRRGKGFEHKLTAPDASNDGPARDRRAREDAHGGNAGTPLAVAAAVMMTHGSGGADCDGSADSDDGDGGALGAVQNARLWV